jgi:taurine transport system substrate-binding protein
VTDPILDGFNLEEKESEQMRTETNRNVTSALRASLAALLATTTCCTALANAAPELPTLTVGYFKGPNPETVGQKYELFAPNIRLSSVESGITAFQEMVGGSMQVAGGIGTPPLAIALLKSMPLKVIYVEYTFRQELVAAAAIKRAQDLVGKTIAVTSGTTGDQSFNDYLKRNGVDPASVKTLNMTGTAMLGAFKRGDIAGAYIWDPVRSALLADGGHALDATNPLAVVVASETVIKEHPAAIQAYVCAIAKANDFILTHRQEALKVFTDLLNGDQARAEQVFTTREYLSPEVAMSKWMGNNGANLANMINGVVNWANAKSATPSAQLPDAHSIIDTRFAAAAANGACK